MNILYAILIFAVLTREKRLRSLGDFNNIDKHLDIM